MSVSHIRKKPGPVPLKQGGERLPHYFKAGPDSRRFVHDEARRQARLQLEDLCKELTPLAMETLEGLLGSDNEKVRLEALGQILDRGWGRSVDRVAILQVGLGASGSASDLSLDQLMARAERMLEAPIGTIIGVEVTDET